MMVIVPVASMAQAAQGQSAGAILHTKGGVWVNGSEAQDASAVFAGDLVETKVGFSANLSLEGTTVLIGPESVTKFQGNFLELDHGNVSVGTTKSFEVHVNCLQVVPVRNEWTEYEVTDVNRTAQVAARKDDVNVNHALGRKTTSPTGGSQQASVHEGEQRSYDETQICGAPPGPTGAGNGISAKWIGAAAGGGGLLLLLLLLGGGGSGGKSQLSPSTP